MFLDPLPFYRRLAPTDRARLPDFVSVFAREKTFNGAKGMEVIDEVRVVLSACAARLILHLDLGYYDRLTEIVVYPHAPTTRTAMRASWGRRRTGGSSSSRGRR